MMYRPENKPNHNTPQETADTHRKGKILNILVEEEGSLPVKEREEFERFLGDLIEVTISHLYQGPQATLDAARQRKTFIHELDEKDILILIDTIRIAWIVPEEEL